MFDKIDSNPDNFTTPVQPEDDNNRLPAADPEDPFAPLPPDGDKGNGRRKSHHARNFFIWAAVIVAIAAAVAIWLRYFNPVVEDAMERGYVRNVERRGLIFKTFEGDMLTNFNLTDTTRTYQRDCLFSVVDDSLARLLQSYQGTGREVRITYKKYSATVPWRGSSKMIVTAVELIPVKAATPVKTDTVIIEKKPDVAKPDSAAAKATSDTAKISTPKLKKS